MKLHISKNRTIAGLLVVCLLLTLCASVFSGSANAAESSGELKNQLDQLQQEKDAIAEKIQQLEGKVSENAKEIEKLTQQKNLIDQEISLLHQQIDLVNQQISTCVLLIQQKQEELDAAQAKLALLQKQNKERIRAMEKNGKLSYWSVLFKANSFIDLLDRLKMVQEIAAADKARVEAMCRAAEEVSQAKQELEVEKAAMEATRQELLNTQARLDAKRREAEGLLNQLVAKGEEFELLIAQSEDKQSDLMNQIAQKEKDYDDAALQEWLATSIPETTAPTEPDPDDGGDDDNTDPNIPVTSGWLLPIASYTYLSDPFGMRWHPIHKDYRMHYGVDLAAPTGTPIYATRGGVVTTTDFEAGGAGYYVSINHGDGFASIYMHMTHYIVAPGQVVSAGEVIGYCGSTGGSTGPHLHFGISYMGTYVDPAKYIPI